VEAKAEQKGSADAFEALYGWKEVMEHVHPVRRVRPTINLIVVICRKRFVSLFVRFK
jgi:hypothetical protein